MNELVILIFLAFLPVLLITLYIYHKDKNKEPPKLLLKLFILGILSCILVVEITSILKMILPFMTKANRYSNYLNFFLYTFIGVGFIEELCKWFIVYFIGYNNKEFNESFDIIVYSAFVSLGFALIENIIYIQSEKTIKTAFFRAISSVPTHAFIAVFMGYLLLQAKTNHLKNNKKQAKNYLLCSILIPTLLHGTYDFCILSNIKLLTTIFIALLVFFYLITIIKTEKLAKNSKPINTNKYCNSCGHLITGQICSKCGARQE